MNGTRKSRRVRYPKGCDKPAAKQRQHIAPCVSLVFDRNVFDFCGVKLSPKDFNNKAPGRAAHPGFSGGLSMNAEGVRQTALL